MASSIALRRASSTFINKFRSASVLPSSSISRSFNTNAQMRNYNEDTDEERNNLDINRRSASDSVSRRPNLFADVLDPFSPTRSLSQVLNLMDQMLENPFAASRGVGVGGGVKRGWDAKEDKDAFYLKIDMPGLGKEDVKISVEENTLIIKGQGEKESDQDGENRRRYSSRIDLPEKFYKLDEIKAEMKNGVLKVVVPKVKEEERKDVFQVKID